MSTQVLQITELTPKSGAIHQVSSAWAALCWLATWDKLGPDMASDFRRQIVTFVEAPKFLAHRAAKADDCWAFGDDVSDVPMWSAVGHPVAAIGDHALDSVARSRGWRLLHLVAPEDLSLVHANLSVLVGETI
jgi:hypothetical protein